MNRVNLVGRLTRDPELRYTSSNIPVVTFTVAVNRTFTNQNGEREADFINIVAWRKQAENVKNYVSKGSQVGIDGRIQTRSYDDNNGNRRYITEVVADSVQFLESRQRSENRASSNGYQNQGGYQQQNQSQNNMYSGNAPQQNRNSFMDDMNSIQVDKDPFEEFGSSIDISDDDLPF